MSIRFFLIYASFATVLFILATFLTGPFWGLPLDYEKGQHLQLVQIALPPFIAYLTAAVAFARAGISLAEPKGERGRMLRLLCQGGLVVFVLGFALATCLFYATGRGLIVSGLNYGQYSTVITLILAVLGATTSAVSAIVFSVGREE